MLRASCASAVIVKCIDAVKIVTAFGVTFVTVGNELKNYTALREWESDRKECKQARWKQSMKKQFDTIGRFCCIEA